MFVVGGWRRTISSSPSQTDAHFTSSSCFCKAIQNYIRITALKGANSCVIAHYFNFIWINFSRVLFQNTTTVLFKNVLTSESILSDTRFMIIHTTTFLITGVGSGNPREINWTPMWSFLNNDDNMCFETVLRSTWTKSTSTEARRF